MTNATLITAVRNEGPDLLEWVAYHRLIGFSRIAVWSNDCSDGSDTLLDALAETGWITHHRHTPPDGVSAQDAVAALALLAVQGTDWLMWLDADEFLNPAGTDLAGLIARIGAADGIALNWRNFGDGGHDVTPPGLVTEAFTTAAPLKHRLSRTVKTLHRLDERVEALFIHRPLWRAGAQVNLLDGAGKSLDAAFLQDRKENGRPEEMVGKSQQSHVLGQINHYAIKAVERVAFKQQARGNGLIPGAKSGRFGFGYLRRFNHNDEVDRSIQRHLPGLRAMMDQALAHPAVAAAHAACAERFAAMLADLAPLTRQLAADRTGKSAKGDD